MKSKKCTDIYQAGSMEGEWLVDNYEHKPIATADDGVVIQICAYCEGKIYPKDEWK
jgi:hypothetical protein